MTPSGFGCVAASRGRTWQAPNAASRRWRDGFIQTLLARDLPDLGSTIPSTTLRRFWTMLAHWHGQLWNGAEFGRAFGVSHTTVRRYLDLLTSVFVVRQFQPWFENISKRQVRILPRSTSRTRASSTRCSGSPTGRM